MGRAPCCDKANVKKGPWSPEEDSKLKVYIDRNGTGGNWISLPQKAGLRRCGKSCRLRWLNYLRPNIKHGDFSEDEDRVICSLYATIGSRWSIIAGQLPGRTDNDIKNYWNTKLKKKLMALASASSTTASIKPDQAKPPTMYSSVHSQLSSLYKFNYGSNPTITTNSYPNPNHTSERCLETSLSLFQTQMQNQQYYHPLMFESTTDKQTSCSSNNSDNGGSFGNKDIGRFQNFNCSNTMASAVVPIALNEHDQNKGFMLNGYEEKNNFMSQLQFDSMNSSSDAPALMEFYDIEGDLSLINIGDNQNHQVINNKTISLDQPIMNERGQRMMMYYFNNNYY